MGGGYVQKAYSGSLRRSQPKSVRSGGELLDARDNSLRWVCPISKNRKWGRQTGVRQSPTI